MEKKGKGLKGFVVLEVLAILTAIHFVGAAVTGVVFWEIKEKKELAAIKKEVVVQQSEKLEKMEVKNGSDSEK